MKKKLRWLSRWNNISKARGNKESSLESIHTSSHLFEILSFDMQISTGRAPYSGHCPILFHQMATPKTNSIPTWRKRCNKIVKDFQVFEKHIQRRKLNKKGQSKTIITKEKSDNKKFRKLVRSGKELLYWVGL